MQFRKDINGLRAIAVIAVVLFHFNASWMSGGFAGVDVFFVISGFLMTGIIFRGIEQENFSILKFYVARANRIIPALAVLCLVLLVFGWFYLTPLDYKALGKHVASSVGFLSNVVYWRESGYFDAASHEKWLLHTWSLSAEWQFYIIYPLVLVAMRKFMSVKAMKATVLLITVLGFIFCVIATYKWPNPSYYLLPTRAWEMMLGGVACLYPLTIQDKRKKLVEWLGLALIFGSYFLISKDNPWPGYLAIFPVLGSFLIIQAQRNDSIITSNVVFQKLGAWSYSIYLWHWPLVVAIYYFSLNDMFIYIGITLSVLFGFLSNKYIEKIKFRNDFTSYFSYLKCKPIYQALVIGVFGGVVFININIINYPEYILGHNINDNGKAEYIGLQHDHLINTVNVTDIDFVGIGDSNLVHLSFGVKNSGKTKVVFSGAGSCLTFPDYTRKPYASFMNDNWLVRCSSIYKKVLEHPNKDIIWSQSWTPTAVICTSNNCKSGRPEDDYYLVLKEQITKMSQLVGENRVINLIGWSPAPKESLVKCTNIKAERCSKDVFTVSSDIRIKVNDKLNEISSELENVNFINPFDAICNKKNECKTVVNGKNLFFDNGHFSGYGALKVWPYIEEHLKKGIPVDLP